MNSIHLVPKHYPTHQIFELDELKNVHPTIKSIVSYIIIKRNRNISRESIKKYFSRMEDWNIFINAVKPKLINSILISDHYAIFYKRNDPVRPIPYLVGVNEDDRAFIDIVDVYISHYPGDKVQKIGEFDGLSIYKTSDKNIWTKAYRYEIDFDLSSKDEIFQTFLSSQRTIARIQGDLIAVIERNGLKTYHDMLLHEIKMFIAEELQESIARRILNILSNYFDIDGDEIITNLPHGKNMGESWEMFLPKINDVERFMTNVVYSELDISDWIKFLGIDDVRIEKRPGTIEIESEILRIKIFSTWRLGHFNTAALRMVVDFPILRETPEIVKKIHNEISTQLEWRPIEEMHGRHRVRISNALPNILRVTIQLPIGVRMLNVNLPMVVKGFVKIEHPEHKEKMLYFNDPVTIRFDTINVNGEIIRRRNYYRIKYKYYLSR